MKLKTLLTAALALLVVGVFSIPDTAEAKRFGGGGSFGKQSKTMPRQAQQPTQTQKPTQTQGQQAAAGAAGKTSGASRWLGPLAGLAAGGLLASLFFGDGFEGFQIMDFLLIAGLVFGGFMLFRMFKRSQAGPRPAAAGAFGGTSASAPMDRGEAFTRNAGPDSTAQSTPQTQAPRTGGHIPPAMGDAPPQSNGRDEFPHWFDGISFLDGAKTHFIRLQAAWDKADFRDIRDYTTPGLFAELQRERAQLGAEQYTEVVQLNAEMVTIQREDDLVIASIRFSGLIREDSQGTAEPFNEVWHVQHVWDNPEGDWLIAGIQQD